MSASKAAQVDSVRPGKPFFRWVNLWRREAENCINFPFLYDTARISVMDMPCHRDVPGTRRNRLQAAPQICCRGRPDPGSDEGMAGVGWIFSFSQELSVPHVHVLSKKWHFALIVQVLNRSTPRATCGNARGRILCLLQGVMMRQSQAWSPNRTCMRTP